MAHSTSVSPLSVSRLSVNSMTVQSGEAFGNDFCRFSTVEFILFELDFKFSHLVFTF